MGGPEQQARSIIDRLLTAAGWHVCDLADSNIHAATGVAIREFPLDSGSGYADYLLYLDGRAAGVIEAKKPGATLTGVERQSARYAQGLPATLPAWERPLPFIYESTGDETHFTNGLDPEPRARNVFAFHRPETLLAWLNDSGAAASAVSGDQARGRSHAAQEARATYQHRTTFFSRVREMSPRSVRWKHNHAEPIVGILREEWGRGNEFTRFGNLRSGCPGVLQYAAAETQ